MKLEVNKLISKGDLDEISKFDIENISDYLNDPFTFTNGIVYGSNDNVLGCGVIRVINEFKIVIDSKLPNYIKAKVLKLLLDKALKLKQCNEVIISLTQPENFIELQHYKDLIQKHYNFQEETGIVLRLET